MFRQTVDRCPDDLWLAGKHPRAYWRIAFHASYYAHMYLSQDLESFKPWGKTRVDCRILWDQPKVEEPYSKAEILEYIDFIAQIAPERMQALDLTAPYCGFPWYQDLSKIEHLFLALRHLQGHVGQLSELLMARDIEIDWIGPMTI
ncbi:MAG: hypothetical protein JSS72_11025 [Armatimonadetes bacterium]|nr:hypothetical protein [Armatimonadota bacterium]